MSKPCSPESGLTIQPASPGQVTCPGTLRTFGRMWGGLTVHEGVQVAKDAEAVVGPLGRHGQLP